MKCQTDCEKYKKNIIVPFEQFCFQISVPIIILIIFKMIIVRA